MRFQPLSVAALGLVFIACSIDFPAEEGALAVSQAFVTSAPPSKFLRAAEPVPGQYIVVLEDGAADVPSVAQMHAHAVGGEVRRTYQHALHGYVLRAPEAAARRLAEDPAVKYVEEDGVVRAAATQTGAIWGLDRVDQRTLPLSGSYTYNVTGAGVNVYIIDTGIRITHSEFGGRASHAFTALSDGNGANDCNGHGTHVAGTAGGSTYGIAKGANLHAVRVLDCTGYGSWSDTIAGIDWVTANRVLPAVANMSLWGGASQALDDAVTRSINTGVTYSVIAGNDSGLDACNYSPARTPAALTVGATTNSDARSSFSNIGPCLDLFAPGSGITSAWYSSDTATMVLDGTSMAAPHVAGAAALYLSVNPTATPSQVEAALEGNATAGAITSAGTGSPNLLLYTAFISGGGQDAASLNWGSVADFVMPGQVFRVRVNATNTGSATWSGAGSSNWYRLGATSTNQGRFAFFPKCGGYSNSKTDARVYTCASIGPGGSTTHAFDVRAPWNTTSVNVSAQMVHDGAAWFGNTVSKRVGVGQAYCGTALTQCILYYRPDILPFYASNGWDTSCSNRNAIINNWCSIDPSGCGELKSGSCAGFNNTTRCTNGLQLDGTPIDPATTFDGFRVCGTDHQIWRCQATSAPSFSATGDSCY